MFTANRTLKLKAFMLLQVCSSSKPALLAVMPINMYTNSGNTTLKENEKSIKCLYNNFVYQFPITARMSSSSADRYNPET